MLIRTIGLQYLHSPEILPRDDVRFRYYGDGYVCFRV